MLIYSTFSNNLLTTCSTVAPRLIMMESVKSGGSEGERKVLVNALRALEGDPSLKLEHASLLGYLLQSGMNIWFP